MTTAIATVEESGLSTEFQRLTERLKALVAKAVPDNTRRAYRKAWERFCTWCETQQRSSLPAEPVTVALYVAALQHQAVSTVRQALAAIGRAHGLQGHLNPCLDVLVKMAVRGMTKEKPHGAAGTPKTALVARSVRKAVGDAQMPTFREARRRAVLVIGFFAALRRSELVALRVHDVEETEKGLLVYIRRSKTDQSGHGHSVALLYQSDPTMCPIRVLRAWIARLTPTSGEQFLFPSIRGARVLRDVHMSEASVVAIVKDAAKRCGLPAEKFAAHSLRSGFATTAAEAERRAEAIQAQLRHKSPAMTLKYVQQADKWKNNASAGLG